MSTDATRNSDEDRAAADAPAGTAAVEERLLQDEARLDRDELVLAVEARALRDNRHLTFGLATALVIAVAGLAVGLAALHRDITTVAGAPPKDGSIGTAALKADAVTADKLAAGGVDSRALADGAVSTAKLAPGAVAAGRIAPGAVGSAELAGAAVTADAVAPGAIGRDQLADGAVTGQKVATNSLTGADVAEETLGRVRRATRADGAAHADDTTLLAGKASSSYLSGVTMVRRSSSTTASNRKGPFHAVCPAGARIIAGGAEIEGGAGGVAIVRSAPSSDRAWAAEAEDIGAGNVPWQLVVIAICGVGGTP